MNSLKARAYVSPTNEFIYKNQIYPFNLQIASVVSMKIKKNKEKYKLNQRISLLEKREDAINLSEDSIKNFVSFCQCQTIDINDENAIDLNYLSNEYDIPQLRDITNQHITSNDKLLFKQYIFNLKSGQLNNELYEEDISKLLSEFIDNDDLINLPISSIYRILQKSENLNDNLKFNFILKCLKKIGKKASVLLHCFNFSGDNKEYLVELLSDTEYCNKIDLNFIDSEIIISLHQQQRKKIEELQKQLIEKEQKYESYKKHHKIKTIYALYIIPLQKHPTNPEYDPFDIDFIHSLNTKEVQICADTLVEDKLMNTIENDPNFLESYNVVICGNGNGGGKYSTLNYIFFDLLTKFRDNGGSVLFLHDFNIGEWKDKNGNPYDILKNDLGYKGLASVQWQLYKKCRFHPEKCGDLMKIPYKLDQNQVFDITETHETPSYSDEYKFIESSEYPIFHYYSENSKKRVADCSMGHNSNLSLFEKKLLFNIIYHLSQL